jgi:hypothetical protein
MLDYQDLIIRPFAESLRSAYNRTYGLLKPEYGTFIEWAGHLALENIANSDMLYHNVDHTMMVTAVGQEILIGKHLSEGGITPEDWLHFMVSVLCHDIGYVRGICRGDRGDRCATGAGDETMELPATGSNAVLTPYHVDRGRLFIRERFGGRMLIDLDAEKVASWIEMTRFPPPDDERYRDTRGLPGLVRAADFIGQLGDPNYLRKIPALYYEFEEIGLNAKIGYRNPGDMRTGYASFFWKVVNPYIQDALGYLRVTHEGKQWIANLHSHVFDVEHTHA